MKKTILSEKTSSAFHKIAIAFLIVGFCTGVFFSLLFTVEKNDLADGELQNLAFSLEWDDEEHTSLSAILPEVRSDNCVVALQVSYRHFRVMLPDLDNRCLISVGDDSSVYDIRSCVFHLPDLPAGTRLQIVLENPYQLNGTGVSYLYLGSEDGVHQKIFRQSFLLILLSALLATVALILLLYQFYLLSGRSAKYFDPEESPLWLAVFCLLCAFWIFCDTPASQFLGLSHVTLYYCSYLAFTLLPIPLCLYFTHLLPRRKIFNLVAACYSLLLVLFWMLALLAGIAMIRMIPTLYYCIACGLGILVYSCADECFRVKSRNGVSLFLATVLFSIMSIASSVTFLLTNTSAYLVFFACGVLLFVIIMLLNAFSRMRMSRLRAARCETLENLSLLDPMTGMNNNTAFERMLEDPDTAGKLGTFVVIDIENLPAINLANGHVVGDEAVKTISTAVLDAFSDVGQCYRKGGTEFCAVILDRSRNTVLSRIRSLKERLKTSNQMQPTHIEVSIGYAYGYLGERGEPALEIYRRADRSRCNDLMNE